MIKNTRIRHTRNAVSLGLLAAIAAACSDQSATPPKVSAVDDSPIAKFQEPDLYQNTLQQFVERFDKASIEEKDRMIRELYGERTALVPFSYKYVGKGGFDYGNVFVGLEGRVGVYHRIGEARSGFELANYSRSVMVDPFHRVRLDDRMKFVIYKEGEQVIIPSNSTHLKIPNGYSVLTVEKSPFSPQQIGDMLGGLRQFATENPEVGITRQGIAAVQDGLRKLGYPTGK